MINNEVVENTIHDEDDGSICLHAKNGILPCYYQYANKVGWDNKLSANGNCKLIWSGEGEQKPVVSLKKYHRF